MNPGLLTLIQGVILGLVSYRIWRLIAVDDLTAPVRPSGRVGSFLACAWCAGFWITIGVTALVWWLWGLENVWLAGGVATVIVGWLGEKL